jgi:CDP-6-deoxy-D-xylo-4-hexulose-3-dehydrase
MVNNIEREDLDSVIVHLQQDDPKLTHGPKVREFEANWNSWLGSKYSVMVNSGASANDLSMLALKEIYGHGEVIVPPLTWVSDVASIIHAGLQPVFVDINLTNLSFDLEELVKAINPNTRAIFITHVLGINALTAEILDLCASKNIKLIEDVCESHGATFMSKKVGTFGFASNFSFYYAHHMTTIEGGMISTDDEEFYETIRMMRSHGMTREVNSGELKQSLASASPDLNSDFIFKYAAHNMRPNEINGILGISQLPRLDKNIAKRTENFMVFLNNLNPNKFITTLLSEGSSNYAFPIILKKADQENVRKIETRLKDAGIEFRRGLSGGGSQIRQPYLKKLIPGINPSEFLNTDHIHFNSWYVGNYPEISTLRVKELTEQLNSAF